jgi:small subunit ribosomal protein S21
MILTPCFLSVLSRVLGREKLYQRAMRDLYYEKPTKKRRRIAHEHAERVYNAEMSRKIEFIARTNRVDPWLR